ncbi:uncharacterized protein LOC126795558 [Argentina anserina]|uniref:uncharacterized protein LOC126795558 n=1 Tax=Argentina anserina TaxID=57926 RepID=UPI00217631E4|nr:uncharacterized protein LOC126795558 [Potentilla anserina]
MEEPEGAAEQQALQLKSLAESKYKASNFKSALKYAKRAHHLCPDLDGVASMVTAFDILRVAHKRGGGPTDPNWYKIIQVEPFAHINTIKSKYKKLALLLHPDKSPHLGSDEAFKLVGEAFRVLSDRIRRKEYDLRLRIEIQDREMGESSEGLGFKETFWTACSTCRLLHQFETRYLGLDLVCPSCKKRFKAVEVGSGGGVRCSQRLRKASGGERGGGDVEREGSDGEVGRRLRKRMSSVGEVLKRCETKKAKVVEETMTLAEIQAEVKRKKMGEEGREKKKKKKGKNVEVERRSGLKKGKNAEVERRAVAKKARDLGSAERRERENLEAAEGEGLRFFDFSKDKRSFKKGQVWAVYDEHDGMPRNYGLVDEVVSFSPFEMRISWLEHQNNGDQWLASWEEMGLLVPCGRFKVVRLTTTNSVHIFSHMVNCDRVAREIYRIYPKKGSVWAIYNEAAFDSDGRNLLVKEKRCYDIVVFLTSYSEMHGLSMGYLEKVDGFDTVFKRREIGAHAIRCLEKDELRLISHEIPAKKLSGNEAPNLSKDCWELDPAALPLDMLTFG